MRGFKRVFTFFVTASLIFGLIPPSLAASENEDVLTSLGHKSTTTVSISAGQRSVTLYVANSYAGLTVDLSNHLEISYDDSIYQYVVATPSALAQVDGAAVSLSITYNRLTDGDNVPKSTTVYTVNVVRASRIAPVFGGVISKSGKFPGNVLLSTDDFTSKFTLNDGPDLGGVVITGSNLTTGTLYLNGEYYTLGTLIPVSELNELVYSSAQTGTVYYNVYGYAGDGTAELSGIATLAFNLSPLSLPTVTGSIIRTVAAGSCAVLPRLLL